MSGTKTGGMKAAATNKARQGADWYKKIGARGGAASGTGGYYHAKMNGDIDHIVQSGRKGGAKSRRGPAINPRTTKPKKQPAFYEALGKLKELARKHA